VSAPAHPEPDCEVLADALAPGAGGPEAAAPPDAVRLPRLLAGLESLFVRADALLARGLAPDDNPFARLGPFANAALLLAVVSGVLLLVWYSPSVQSAWSSLAALGPRSPGGLVRSVHRHSSDLAMLLLLLHALRTFVGRKFAGPRWLAWSSGVGLLALVGFIGWTGYWLVWDVRAQGVALESMKLLDVLPVFGEPLGRLFTADRTVPSLLFFVIFFLHLLLPLAVAAGLALHLARLSRSRLLPGRAVLAAVTGAVVAAALILPATSAEPARMAVKPETFTMDWWYLWPLAVTTRLTGGGAWLAGGLAFAAAAAVPWWLGRRRPRAAYQAKVDPARCFACTQCAQDCPFGAIAMVPRTDGRPWPAQAQIDPDRCLGCGVCTGSCDTQAIGLPWFDARRVAPALRAETAAAAAAGRAPAIALVCAQADGGWDAFQARAWQARLPGYEVRPVPSAGWVEPKVIEGLVTHGARAVLVVSTVNADPHCREGDTWLPLRLRGAREPEFRPKRADPRKVAHVRFDPNRPGELTAAAARLLRAEPPAPPAERPARGRRILFGSALAAGLLALTLALGDAPFRHPTAAQPEFVFTFRAFGDWVDAGMSAAAADRPVHMRAAVHANRTRLPVVVRLEIDGVGEELAFRPKGLKSDGASIGELRRPLPPGPHRLSVRLATQPGPEAPAEAWSAEVVAERGRLIVVSFEPGVGFRREDGAAPAEKTSPPGDAGT
jgi:ferredoxin